MRALEGWLIALAALASAGDDPVDWAATLDAMGQGDVAALARLRRLVTVQLARLGAYDVASDWDDFAQEVVIRTWRAHRDGRIREAQAVPGFVRTTTRNAFVDWIRKHHREVDLDDDAIEVVASGAAGDESGLDPGLELVLREAIDGLEERHRSVIESLYLEGRSYDETASHLGRPRGTINRQQREAMQILRERLDRSDALGRVR